MGKSNLSSSQGSYTCSCREGYLDLSADGDPGRVCTSSSAECDLCNLNGRCVLEREQVNYLFIAVGILGKV